MNLSFISEAATMPISLELLEESNFNADGLKKIRARAKLQERDVKNNNGRMYDESALKAIESQLAPKATERLLVGELDHPSPQSSDLETRLKRSSTISLKESCVLYTELRYDGRFIVTDFETLTNDPGINLYRLLKDKVGIGFSLRAFGSGVLMRDGTTLVTGNGLKALTYDVVSNPSHSNAVITEFISESTNILGVYNTLNKMICDISAQKQLLQESSNGINLLSDNGDQLVCFKGTCIKGTLEETTVFLRDMIKNDLKKIYNNNGRGRTSVVKFYD